MKQGEEGRWATLGWWGWEGLSKEMGSELKSQRLAGIGLGRLRKNIPGRRPSKCKSPEAGMSVAHSKKGRRAGWLECRGQERAAQDEIRKVGRS